MNQFPPENRKLKTEKEACKTQALMVRCLTEEQKNKKMAKINLNVIFEPEMNQFLNEKVNLPNGVTVFSPIYDIFIHGHSVMINRKALYGGV